MASIRRGSDLLLLLLHYGDRADRSDERKRERESERVGKEDFGRSVRASLTSSSSYVRKARMANPSIISSSKGGSFWLAAAREDFLRGLGGRGGLGGREWPSRG